MKTLICPCSRVFPFSTFQAEPGWFTITPMLQDLDSLSARIGQLVQLVQRLQSDRAALQARVTSLEQERSALRDQLLRQESAQKEAIEQVRDHAGQMDALRKQAEAAEARLRDEAARYRADYETARQGLQASQAE